MPKIKWKPGNMLYPVPAVIVTCGTTPETYNAITIAWTGTICSDPPMTYISVRPSRHSYPIIKADMAFVINLTTKDLVYPTDFAGVKSGRDMNKLEHLGLEYTLSDHHKIPMLSKSPVCLECIVTDILPLGTHDMFIAKIIDVQVDDQYIDTEDRFHLDKSNPICYSHGQYYELGPRLGKFGYSIEKEKLKKTKK